MTGAHVDAYLLAHAARVRPDAVRRVLAGEEVWPRTYAAIAAAARDLGMEVPAPAPRAPRCRPHGPCAECDGLRAELAELRAANVPPPAPTPAPTAPTSVAEVVPKVVRERVPPPRRLHILLDGAEVAPEATPGESDSATG